MNEIEKAIALIDETWKSLVGDYRYQNGKKIDTEEAYYFAMKALKKQIPASPTAPQQGYRRCPSCNAGFIEELGTTNYCGNCGKALKWEEQQ